MVSMEEIDEVVIEQAGDESMWDEPIQVNKVNTTLPVATIPKAFEQDLRCATQILKGGGCSEIYVFGSLAEGSARPGSDIDLAVRGCPPKHFFKLWGKLLRELKHSVDLVDLDSRDPFAEFLQNESEMIRIG